MKKNPKFKPGDVVKLNTTADHNGILNVDWVKKAFGGGKTQVVTSFNTHDYNVRFAFDPARSMHETYLELVSEASDPIIEKFEYKGEIFDTRAAAEDYRIRRRLDEYIRSKDQGVVFTHLIVDNKEEVIKILKGEF